MIVKNKNQLFNMFNTNGRRADVIEAYRIYLEILQNLSDENLTEFTSFPNSLTQFRFYQEAINRSPEVFKKHSKYDKFMAKLSGDYEAYFYNLDYDNMCKDECGRYLLNILDEAIEQRARHYTSNLVKIGFTDTKRKITEVGKAFVNSMKLRRDSIERFFPIKDSNLIFLRQLMKLRFFTNEKNYYYNPMSFAISLLIEHERISVYDFTQMIQLLSPYKILNEDDLEEYIKIGLSGNKGELISFYQVSDKDDSINLNSNKIINKVRFKTLFKNRKSSSISDIYYDFYKLVIEFRENQNDVTYNNLKVFYVNNKYNLDSAFNYNLSLFNFRGVNNLSDFIEKNKENKFLNVEQNKLNYLFHKEFQQTKLYNSILEYGDTLMRLLRVTGIVQVQNGIVSLNYRDIWQALDETINFKRHIFGSFNSEDYREYESEKNSFFSRNISITKIVDLDLQEIDTIVSRIQITLGVETIEQGQEELKNKLNQEFKKHIETNYPKDKVISLLDLFSNRDNDNKIKKETNSDATIPTIFEYICGIALYYISNETYDVLDSFNLTMNADFIPEAHASGGDGDIIARYETCTLMLEVTLMNKQAQKRGEWEPVLRHSANLVIEEYPKPVYTLFIADEFDDNTINIWRSVASVPLKSSREISNDGKVAENVKIFPVSGSELSLILSQNVEVNTICRSMDTSFKPLIRNFDIEWRNKLISSIITINEN